VSPLLKVLKDTVAELALAVDGRVLVALTRGTVPQLPLFLLLVAWRPRQMGLNAVALVALAEAQA
jgi:hypothetical protein